MGGPAWCWLLLGLLPLSQMPPAAPCATGSYLYQPAFCLDDAIRGTPRPDELKPGDICCAVGTTRWSRMGHHFAGAGLPNHSMIVLAMPDGRLGALEAGPHGKLTVDVREAYAHLASYEAEGAPVWVRRKRTPLTPDQSACLSAFCMAHDETKFASLRLGMQATRIRSRGPLRTNWLGGVDLDKRSYFCSELVLNSLVAAGVFEAAPLRPSATYPSDLFFNNSRNKIVERSLAPLLCDWHPPARWVSSPDRCPASIRLRK